MLEKKELEKIAEIKRLSIKNTEKDYMREMLLFLLSNDAGKSLVFKGGTALYKLYSLNRFSEDLDFTLAIPNIDVNKLFNQIIKRLYDIGIEGRIKDISDYKNQKNVKLELKGPLFDGNPKTLSIISVNISIKERPIYDAEIKKIFPKYHDIPTFDVFIMTLNELLAEKIRALLTRDKARDVYDVWFLLNKGAILKLSDVNKKLRKYNLYFNIKLLAERIDDKKLSWELDLKGLIMGSLPLFDAVKKEIIEKVQ